MLIIFDRKRGDRHKKCANRGAIPETQELLLAAPSNWNCLSTSWHSSACQTTMKRFPKHVNEFMPSEKLSGQRKPAYEKTSWHYARDYDCARRLRGSGTDRVYHAGRRTIWIQAALDDHPWQCG